MAGNVQSIWQRTCLIKEGGYFNIFKETIGYNTTAVFPRTVLEIQRNVFIKTKLNEFYRLVGRGRFD